MADLASVLAQQTSGSDSVGNLNAAPESSSLSVLNSFAEVSGLLQSMAQTESGERLLRMFIVLMLLSTLLENDRSSRSAARSPLMDMGLSANGRMFVASYSSTTVVETHYHVGETTGGAGASSNNAGDADRNLDIVG